MLDFLVAAAGIMVGAYGTHGMRNKPGIDEHRMQAWETAAHYSVRYFRFPRLLPLNTDVD